MRWPLTQRLSSESNDAIIGPMSSGWPTRPSAVISATRLLWVGRSYPVERDALLVGIVVNTVAPGATATDFSSGMVRDNPEIVP
jgi:hypothetical protein